MITMEVRKACLGSNRSHLRSYTVEMETLLWADDLVRVTRLRFPVSKQVIYWTQTTLEEPLHFFHVYGQKYNLQHGRIHLLTTKGSLYFQTQHRSAIPGMDSGQATKPHPVHSPHYKHHKIMLSSGKQPYNHYTPSLYIFSAMPEKTKSPTPANHLEIMDQSDWSIGFNFISNKNPLFLKILNVDLTILFNVSHNFSKFYRLLWYINYIQFYMIAIYTLYLHHIFNIKLDPRSTPYLIESNTS